MRLAGEHIEVSYNILFAVQSIDKRINFAGHEKLSHVEILLLNSACKNRSEAELDKVKTSIAALCSP